MLSYFHYNYTLYYIPTIMLTSNSFIYNNVNYELMCIDACIPLEDWRCDQYHWSNQGVRWLPRKDPRVKKSYFHVDTPNGPSREFVKHAYQLLLTSGLSEKDTEHEHCTNYCRCEVI